MEIISEIKNASPMQYRRICLGWYSHIRLRCAVLGACLFALMALPWMEDATLALAFGAVAGAPFGLTVLVPALGCLVLVRMEKVYGPFMVELVLAWAQTVAPGERLDMFALACAAFNAAQSRRRSLQSIFRNKP